MFAAPVRIAADSINGAGEGSESFARLSSAVSRDDATDRCRCVCLDGVPRRRFRGMGDASQHPFLRYGKRSAQPPGIVHRRSGRAVDRQRRREGNRGGRARRQAWLLHGQFAPVSAQGRSREGGTRGTRRARAEHPDKGIGRGQPLGRDSRRRVRAAEPLCIHIDRLGLPPAAWTHAAAAGLLSPARPESRSYI